MAIHLALIVGLVVIYSVASHVYRVLEPTYVSITKIGWKTVALPSGNNISIPDEWYINYTENNSDISILNENGDVVILGYSDVLPRNASIEDSVISRFSGLRFRDSDMLTKSDYRTSRELTFFNREKEHEVKVEFITIFNNESTYKLYSVSDVVTRNIIMKMCMLEAEYMKY